MSDRKLNAVGYAELNRLQRENERLEVSIKALAEKLHRTSCNRAVERESSQDCRLGYATAVHDCAEELLALLKENQGNPASNGR